MRYRSPRLGFWCISSQTIVRKPPTVLYLAKISSELLNKANAHILAVWNYESIRYLFRNFYGFMLAWGTEGGRAVAKLSALFLALFMVLPGFSYERGTLKDVRNVIVAGIKHYQRHGLKKALKKFNDNPAPEFYYNDIFLGVASQGEEGVILANPDDLKSVGKKVKLIQDTRGKYVGKDVIKKVKELKAAGKKGGWLPIIYLVNPVNNEVERKQVYIRLHDGYIFGSGIYHPNE